MVETRQFKELEKKLNEVKQDKKKKKKTEAEIFEVKNKRKRTTNKNAYFNKKNKMK